MSTTDLSLAVVLSDVEAAGYRVVRETSATGRALPAGRGGWHLLDSDGDQLLIGEFGCTAPRKRDAILEGARRVESDRQS